LCVHSASPATPALPRPRVSGCACVSIVRR
jgi:hypothetical protein